MLPPSVTRERGLLVGRLMPRRREGVHEKKEECGREETEGKIQTIRLANRSAVYQEREM
jgi:hypothetical protein